MIFDIDMDGRVEKVEAVPSGAADQYLIRMNGREIQADARLIQPGVLSLLLENRSYRCVQAAAQGSEADAATIAINERSYSYRVQDPRSLRRGRARAEGAEGALPLKASMPGRVVRLLVEKGAQVEPQQGILVVEAMKMQNEVKSPKAGRIAELRVVPGEAVASGQVLAVVE